MQCVSVDGHGGGKRKRERELKSEREKDTVTPLGERENGVADQIASEIPRTPHPIIIIIIIPANNACK